MAEKEAETKTTETKTAETTKAHTPSQKVFRKKAMDRIQNPEQFDKYVRVTRPRVWLILGAVLCFLIGLIYWSVNGSIRATKTGPMTVRNGEGVVRLSKENQFDQDISLSDVGEGTEVVVMNKTYTATGADRDEDGRIRIYVPVDLMDGEYVGEVVTERISAIRFLLDD